MSTVRRHPVPADSYEPDRPLNDLGRDQLKHFLHVADRLPKKVRSQLPPAPSPEDGMAAGRFIAAVTQALLQRRRPSLKFVSRPVPKRKPPALSLAAAAEAPSAPLPPDPGQPSSSKRRRPRP